MTRAAKLCSAGGCTNLQPCPEPGHTRKAWEGSTRNERTDSRYRGALGVKRAHAVMRMHDGICHVCHRPGSDEVDHVIALSEGGEDTLANLRPIHSTPCHTAKTQAEAQRARRPA